MELPSDDYHAYQAYAQRVRDEHAGNWINATHMLVLLAIAKLVLLDGIPNPTNRRIAIEAGNCGIRTVQRARKEASERKLLLVKPQFSPADRQQTPNEYEFRVPDGPVMQKPTVARGGRQAGVPRKTPSLPLSLMDDSGGSVRAQGPLTSFERAAMQLVAMGKPVPVAWI